MAFLAAYWREAGHAVRVVEAMGDDRPGDVGILHVDLTVVPDEVPVGEDRDVMIDLSKGILALAPAA